MTLSMIAFVTNDTIIKLVSADLPLFPSIFLRGVFATLLLLVMAWRTGVLRPALSGEDKRRIVLRACADLAATVCFLTALFNMPMANAMAILQATPLAVTLTAAVVLGEKVGWRRYSAISIGFIGVLMIVQPGADGFTVYSLWALATVACSVARDLTTRGMRLTIPSVFVALSTSILITVAGGIGSMVQPWGSGLSLSVLGMLAASAVFLVGGYLFNVLSMRIGEMSFVSMFRYVSLLWAIVMGVAVFGNWPNASVLIGSAIVVATGGYTVYRERAMRKRAAAMRPFGAA